jgi:hypothetical protein
MSKQDKIIILEENSCGGTFATVKDRKDVDLSKTKKLPEQLHGMDVYIES